MNDHANKCQDENLKLQHEIDSLIQQKNQAEAAFSKAKEESEVKYNQISKESSDLIREINEIKAKE